MPILFTHSRARLALPALVFFVPLMAQATVSVVRPITPPSQAKPAARVQSAPQPPVLSAENPPEGSADQLIEQQRRQREQYLQMNAQNPLSQEFNVQGGEEALQKAQSMIAPSPAALAQAQKVLSDPRVQRFMKVMAEPRAMEVSQAVVGHPKRLEMLYWVGGWLLFIMFFRAWKFSRPAHWFRRWLEGLAINAVFFLGSAIVIPRWVLGGIYFEMLGNFLRAVGLKS